MSRLKYGIPGYALTERVAKVYGKRNSAVVYLPREWKNRRVAVVLLEPPEGDVDGKEKE